MSAQELRNLIPEKAASEIADWRSSVKRHVPETISYYLEGMLRADEGYSVEEVINFLEQVPSQTTNKVAVPGDPWQEEITAISCAGEQLAQLLRTTSDSQIQNRLKIADCFWQKVLALKEPKHLGGFGLYSAATSMDDTPWAKRTLETLILTKGRIEWQHRVEKRALQLDDKKSCLEIFDHLIRGNSSLHRISNTNDHACQALESAQELSGTTEYERLKTALSERGILP